MNNPVSDSERLARIKINAFSYMKADWYNRLIKVYGNAENILKSTPKNIAQNGAVSFETAERFLRETSKIDPHKELEKTQKLGGRILIQEDPHYPQSLREIAQPPIVIYTRGNIKDEQIKIAMIGTRKPTSYGRKMTTRLAADIARCKITVVSGLARGIDSIAHAAALDCGGITWAVLGTGLGKYYPYENKKLTEQIIESGGAIITEIPFDGEPMAFHFPRRNRIIAGLSLLVVITQCPIKSGAIITAKFALEQGKDVLAVPGPADCPTSEGTNNLIKEGAAVAVNPLDIIEHIPLQYKLSLDKNNLKTSTDLEHEAIYQNLSEDEKTVLKQIAEDDLSLDDIAMRLNWSVSKTCSVLFELEAKSVLTCNCGKYRRKI
jgi:DNA processing protein